MNTTRTRLQRIALVLFGLAAAWTLVVALSGGLVFHVGATRISARSPVNPAIAAVAAAVLSWMLATADQRRRTLHAVRTFLREESGLRRLVRDPPRRLVSGLVLAAAVSAAAFGLVNGSDVAAGSDAYGYVSEADLWAKGSLVVRQPFARDMTWPNAAWTLAPLGYRPYRPASHGSDIVPVYSPGVPMLMAVFELVAGARAVYWVVPLLGGIAVWTTFVMGRRLAGGLVGASAAVLLATSPSFLFEIVAPASDVAATAWWAMAFACALRDGGWAALGSGVAAGFAILTRPNLAPIALMPGVLLAWRALAARSGRLDAGEAPPTQPELRPAAALSSVGAFVAGVAPAVIAVAVINWRLFGSPLVSGYGGFSDLYHWSNLWPNLARYPRWLLETQTPVVLVALLAPFVLPARAPGDPGLRPRAIAFAWLCAIGVIFVLYVFYVPYDEWWYLRFILPLYPLLLVLAAGAIAVLLAPVARMVRLTPGWPTIVVIAVMAWHGIGYARDRGVMNAWRGDQRYVEAGTWIAANLPERAALLSMQHSGSARYYSGRLTIRYDLIAPADLTLVVNELTRLGYHPYFLLDDWEEPIVRDRFQAHTPLGGLDWVPVTAVHSGHVRIYDLAGRRGR